MNRGDVVVVAFPYVTGGRGKNRPALVIQSGQNNQWLSNTIVAMITGNIRLATTEPTQLLIDPSSAEGKSSGLAYPCAVKCENLYTVSQQDILRTLGTLPASLMARDDPLIGPERGHLGRVGEVARLLFPFGAKPLKPLPQAGLGGDLKRAGHDPRFPVHPRTGADNGRRQSR